MVRKLSLVGVVAVVTLSSLAAQSGAASLKGAWRVVEVTTDGKSDTKPQPGLYIFTDRHYSVMRVTAPRSAFPETPTDKDKVSAFDPFIANSGTFEVKGTQMLTRPMVAKNPNVMTGAGGTFDLRFEGTSTLYVTSPTASGGKSIVKLQRVE